MTTIIVHPKDEEQLDAVRALLKTAEISFEEEPDTYDPEFVAKIKESREQIKRGETRIFNIDDL